MSTVFQIQLVRRGFSMLRTALLAAVACVALSHQAFSQADTAVKTWKFVDGREFEAEFVRLTSDGVVLKSAENGREAELKFSRLSIASHYQALKLGKPEAFDKPLIKAEVKPVIAEPEFEIDVDATLAYPFPDDPTIEQWMETLDTELNEKHNTMVLWHMLPEKMQSDAEDVAVLAMEKVGSGIVTQVKTLLGSINTIVQQKREFIFNNQYVKSQPQVIAQLEPLWPKIAGLVDAVAAEEHWKMDNFKKGKLVPWLANFFGKVNPHAMALQEAAAQFMPPGSPQPGSEFKYTIVKQSAGRATIDLEVEGQPKQTIVVQKVGKKWVVPAWMNPMRQGVDEAKKGLDQFSGVPFAVNLAIGGIVSAADKLAQAESQEDFDAEVQQLVEMIQGMVPAGGPGAPAGPGGRGPRGL